MELMKYYNINEIKIEDDNIEVLGKTITNRDFHIEIKNINNDISKHDIKNKIEVGENKYSYYIYLNKTKPNSKLRMNIRKQKNKNYWINVGDDMNFYINYRRYMNIYFYTLIHKLIMDNL